jgi:hypothetical protein
MRSKKGAGVFDSLGGLGIGVMTLAIVLVVGFLIMAQSQEQIAGIQDIDQTNESTFTTAYNATVTTTDAMSDIPNWVPIVVIVSIGGLLLGLVAVFKRS